MNNNTHAVRRRIAACAAAAIVLPGLAACGGDLDPPAQNISRDQAEKDPVPGAERTSGNRLDFGDEFGKRAAPKRDAGPDDRNLNRKDFRDNGL